MHETFEHTADIGIRGTGRSPAQAFAEAALALFGIVSDTASLKKSGQVSFTVTCGPAPLEDLFVDFLNTLLTQAALHKTILTGVRMERLDDAGLTAVASGVRVGPESSRSLRKEVKGATYCQLKVARKGGTWTAQCVVDV